jgi:hypothetical protein
MAAQKRKRQIQRLNLELNSLASDQLERVKTRTGSPSTTEIIRRSLALFDLFTEHTAQGGEVIFRHPDGTEEKVRILG